MLNIDEYLRQLQSGEAASSSVEDLRNEDLQIKSYGRRIPFLKKDRNTRSRILLFKSIAVPFNPFTVAEDDKYNSAKKFRTEKSATTTMLALKKYYNENEAAKVKFLSKVGVAEWDTTGETLTETDVKVFKKFYVSTIFTINKVHINNKAVTGRDNGSDYKVDIRRDEVGKIIEEYTDAEGNIVKMPRFIKTAISLGEFFSACYLQEYKDWEADEGSTRTDDDKAKQKMAIMGKSPLSEDRPGNTMLAMKLPLQNGSLKLDFETMKSWEAKDFAKCFVQVAYTKPIRTKVEAFQTDYQDKDVYADFYEVDMRVPDVEDAKKRGQDTTFEFTTDTFASHGEEGQRILNKIIEALDSLENIDKIILASSYIEPLTNDVIEALCRNLKDTCDLQSLKITEGIVKRNGDLISTIWGEKADGILMDSAMGELREGDVTEEERKLVRSEIMNALSEDDDLEEVDIDIE